MTEFAIGSLIIALIVVNSRRELWKYRAKMRQAQIDSLKGLRI